MKNFVQKWMNGRYGGRDHLNFTLLLLSIAFMIAYCIFHHLMLERVALFFICFHLFRTMSRNIPKRYEENQKWLSWIAPMTKKLRRIKRNVQDRKVYKYCSCPNCGQELRFPRNKGKLILHCKSCGHHFEARS